MLTTIMMKQEVSDEISVFLREDITIGLTGITPELLIGL
jgi:hypothetical protein